MMPGMGDILCVVILISVCWCIYGLVTCLSKVWFVSNAEHQILEFLSKQTLPCSQYKCCQDNLSPRFESNILMMPSLFMLNLPLEVRDSCWSNIMTRYLLPTRHSVSQLQTWVHNSQSLSNIITASLKVVNFVNSRVKCYNNNYICWQIVTT